MGFKTDSKNNAGKGFESSGPRFSGEYEIRNARVIASTVCVFTLDLKNGIVLYNCRYVNTDGKRFIAAAQTKGNDGKYYKCYALYIDDKTAENIMNEIDKMLED